MIEHLFLFVSFVALCVVFRLVRDERARRSAAPATISPSPKQLRLWSYERARGGFRISFRGRK